MDWNWLFSSLAQSVAAIVGVFGAFLISRLLTNQSEYRQRAAAVPGLIAESYRLMALSHEQEFAWFCTVGVNYAYRQVIPLHREHPDWLAVDVYEHSKFPEYVPKGPHFQRMLDVLNGNERVPEEWTKESIITTDELRLPAVRRELASYAEMVKSHCLTVRKMLKDLYDPRASRALNGSLLFAFVLFLLGVIWPLSFLPLNGEPSLSLAAVPRAVWSIRGGFLTLITIAVGIGVVALWKSGMALRYPPTEAMDLWDLYKLEKYSGYVAIAERNRLGTAYDLFWGELVAHEYQPVDARVYRKAKRAIRRLKLTRNRSTPIHPFD